MALRTVLINLNDRSHDDLSHTTPFYVMTKLDNGEITEVVNEILDDLINERITFFETHEAIVRELSKDVHPNSHKTMDFDYSFNNEE